MRDHEAPGEPVKNRQTPRTLSALVQSFTQRGYEGSFRAEGGGLRELGSGNRYAPEELDVEEIARFEGCTDPGDEAMVLALRAADGVRGTYTVAFGPGMDPLDGEMVRRLRDRRSS
jgi:hypothetical protein